MFDMTTNSKNRAAVTALATLAAGCGVAATTVATVPASATGRLVPADVRQAARMLHRTIDINGVEVFYREAGSRAAPTIVLLHGFPTSSHMFRELIPALADRFHIVAPDYPGFGNSEQPSPDAFDYSFDNYALLVQALLDQLGIERYSLYLMDYGAPIGFRLAARYPARVQALIVQNGNAYGEGLRDFWDPIRDYWRAPTLANAGPLVDFVSAAGVRWRYTHGVRNPHAISPDNWNVDLRHLTRAGNAEIQLALFYDYRNNLPLYPAWQTYFREHQPPALVVWGRNDHIFPVEGPTPSDAISTRSSFICSIRVTSRSRRTAASSPIASAVFSAVSWQVTDTSSLCGHGGTPFRRVAATHNHRNYDHDRIQTTRPSVRPRVGDRQGTPGRRCLEQ